MRVITVNDKELQMLCSQLKSMIADSGYGFDTIIAIARGGVLLAEKMYSDNFFIVSCRRGSTALKSGILNKIIRRLPLRINNMLRESESRLSYISHKVLPHHLKEVSIDDKLRNHLQQNKRKVLIVDDASDSGHTILSVVMALRKIAPDNEYRTAVITETQTDSVYNNDYAIFRNCTLIRFPWAPDAAKSRESAL